LIENCGYLRIAKAINSGPHREFYKYFFKFLDPAAADLPQDLGRSDALFDLGVDDLVSKPTPPDVFVTKIRQLVERRKRSASAAVSKGVSGSLAEMGLPEVVQVLWHGRKTCALRISSKKGNGEIGFSEGQIVDARLGTVRGEEAFYQMLTLSDGEFRIDPEYKLGERTIDVSPEGLLLEGMRRLDEGMLK